MVEIQNKESDFKYPFISAFKFMRKSKTRSDGLK